MKPEMRRFDKKFRAAADAISRLDIEQEDRELIADALTAALRGQPDFKAELFQLLASDPICYCVGVDDQPCPDRREIRIAMHLSSAPDGRADSWRARKPIVRCVSCGAAQFLSPLAS